MTPRRNPALILCHTHRLATGQKYITYSWDGDPRAPVLIGHDLLRNDLSLADDFPWPLKFLDEDHARGYRRYIRTDVSFWWVTDLRIRIGNRLEWINQRLLATLAIWELLYREMGVSMSWRDLRPLRWLRSKLVKP